MIDFLRFMPVPLRQFKFANTSKSRGGGRAASLDSHLDLLWYILRNGIAWRALPREFGCWSTSSSTSTGGSLSLDFLTSSTLYWFAVEARKRSSSTARTAKSINMLTEANTLKCGQYLPPP
jgi:transposase